MSYLAILCLETALIGAAVRWLSGGRVVGVARDPFAVFSVAFALLYLVVPLMLYLLQDYRYLSEYDDSTLVAGNAFLLAYWFCALAAYLPFRAHTVRAAVPLRVRDNSETAWLIVLLVLPALAASVQHANAVFSIGLQNFMSDRIALQSGRGSLVLLGYLNGVAIAALALLYRLRVATAPRLARAAYGAAFALYAVWVVFYFGVTGSRNSIFIALCLGLLAFAFAARRIRPSTLIVVSAAIAGLGIGLALWGYYRLRLDELAAGVDIAALVETLATEQLKWNFGNYENVLWLIKVRSWEPQNGATFLSALTSFVPRGLWPDKPLGGGPALINAIYPGSYDLGRRNLSSLTTGLPTEAMLNFGYAGAAIVGAAHGAVLGLIRNLAMPRAGTLTGLLIYALLTLFFGFLLLFAELLGGTMRLVSALAVVGGAAILAQLTRGHRAPPNR